VTIMWYLILQLFGEFKRHIFASQLFVYGRKYIQLDCVCAERERKEGGREKEEEGRGKKSNMQSVEQWATYHSSAFKLFPMATSHHTHGNQSYLVLQVSLLVLVQVPEREKVHHNNCMQTNSYSNKHKNSCNITTLLLGNSHFSESGAIKSDTYSLANNFCRMHQVLQDCIMHCC